MEEHAAQNPKITSKQAKKGKKPSTPGAKGKAGDKAKGQDALAVWTICFKVFIFSFV